MIVGTYLALAKVNDLNHRHDYLDNIDSTESLAAYLGTIENGQQVHIERNQQRRWIDAERL